MPILHFIDEETRTQRGYLTCPKSQLLSQWSLFEPRRSGPGPCLELRSSDFKLCSGFPSLNRESFAGLVEINLVLPISVSSTLVPGTQKGTKSAFIEFLKF